jgi:hypothetical protein
MQFQYLFTVSISEIPATGTQLDNISIQNKIITIKWEEHVRRVASNQLLGLLLDKLTVTQVIKLLMETEDLVQCSQEHTNGPYPEPHESSPLLPILSL